MFQNNLTAEQFLAHLEAKRLASLDEALIEAANTIEGLKKLQDAGLAKNEQLSDFNYNWLHIHVDRKELPKVHKAIGKVTVVCKDVADSRKKLLDVTLRSEKYPGIRIIYRTKLPKGSKCQIVRTRRTRTALVCSI